MEKEFDIMSIFKVFKDHLITIIAIALLLAIATFCICEFVMDEKYESNFKLLIINTTDSNYYQQAIMNATETLGQIYKQLAKSDDIISTIKDDLSLKYTDAVNESFIKSALSVSSDSVGFMTYTVSTSNAELSEDIAKSASKIVPEYLERSGYGTKTEIVNHPSDAVKRSNTTLFTALAFIAGAFFTWLVFFIRLFFNTVIVTTKDISDSFSHPVLGEIPNWEKG